MIHNAISKSLLYHCKDPGKPRGFLLESTKKSLVNLLVTTINSGLGAISAIKLVVLNES